MAQETLVERQLTDGAKLVEQLARDGFDVRAALWLKTSEKRLWYLYIVTPAADEEGPSGYRRLITTIRQMPEPFWVDVFEVKPMGPKDPIAADVLAALRHRSSAVPLRYGGCRLGGVTIEEAFVYPPPSSAVEERAK